ncbi:MAG: DUF58 domain-containing protein [Candidatus Krumholzibacteriota bacterium]
MDWSKIKRNRATASRPAGVYADLDELIRIQFKARDFSFQPRQPVTSVLSGRYASRLRGRGLNFEELRRYLPGDDIRNMDWKVTARTRSPHVRVYTEEKDRAVLLLVDQRQNMFFGTREKLKSVTAAELAALAAWRALSVGDRIGAIVFNDNEMVEIRPQRSQQAVMQILGEVVRQNHALAADSDVPPNPGQLNKALEKARVLAPHDVLVVTISDGMGVDAETERLAAGLTAHNDVLAFLIHDPLRVDPTGQRVTVSDGALQMDLDLTNRSVNEKVAADYRKEQENLTRFLRRLSAPLLMISNQGDVVAQVRRLLGVPGRPS